MRVVVETGEQRLSTAALAGHALGGGGGRDGGRRRAGRSRGRRRGRSRRHGAGALQRLRRPGRGARVLGHPPRVRKLFPLPLERRERRERVQRPAARHSLGAALRVAAGVRPLATAAINGRSSESVSLFFIRYIQIGRDP